jgi:hypothetical protein
MAEREISSEQIANRKYIGPKKTGDNIDADRVANYGFGADSDWGRVPLPLVDIPYDYQEFSNADVNGNYQTITFKQGGSSGATVRTLTLAYDASNNVTSISRS